MENLSVSPNGVTENSVYGRYQTTTLAIDLTLIPTRVAQYVNKQPVGPLDQKVPVEGSLLHDTSLLQD